MQFMRNAEQISSLIGNRKLYIWGSGHFGASIYYTMVRIGVEVTGFIDSNMSGSEFMNFSVKKPVDMLSGGKDKIFIIISPFLSANEISAICNNYGFSHIKDYLTHADINPYHFEVDVAGQCNLRCITCPRGNFTLKHNDGMMTLDNYKKVADKLMSEIPTLTSIQLYSWGEPLLNPEIPKMIAYTSLKGLASAISSNLSLSCDLESVVKAMPTWFRVSISGYDEDTYSVIHKGGQFNLVIENLKLLSVLKKQFAPQMLVEVNYHIYKHNLAGIEKIAQMCQDLGFVFRPNYAYIDPLDSIIEYAQGTPLQPAMEKARQHLVIDIDDAIKYSRESNSIHCICENSFVIHSDLSFRRCAHLYNNSSNILAENFLETSLDELLRKSEECEICITCRSLGVHRFHYAYIDKKLEIENGNKDG